MQIKPFRVIVDGRPFEGKLTGVGYYILEIINQWLAVDSDLQLTILLRKKPSVKLSPRITIIVEPNGIYAKIKPVLWQRFLSSRLIDDCDLYWGTAVFLPVGLPANITTLVTVHDFNHIEVPDTMAWGNRWAHQAWMRKDLKRADYIMANGEGTANRVKAWLGRKCDLIINPPVRATISRVEDPLLSQILDRLKITRPFFLAVGTHEPRKNLALLIDAFVGLKSAGSLRGFSLILAGQSGWKSEILSALIENSAKFDVRSLGYVADEELSALYSGCHAFVFPSIYEGFGMPVREARTCSARVIASDIPEIREASNNVGIFIYPGRMQIMEALRNCENSDFLNEVTSFELQSTQSANGQCFRFLKSVMLRD